MHGGRTAATSRYPLERRMRHRIPMCDGEGWFLGRFAQQTFGQFAGAMFLGEFAAQITEFFFGVS